MFSDARRYRALRQALVLDANNHFEGYTNSDGVELMAGKRPRPSTYCTPPRLLTVAPTPHAPQDDGLPDCRLIRRARHVVRHRNRLWRAAVPPNPLPAVSCCAARPGLPGDDDGVRSLTPQDNRRGHRSVRRIDLWQRLRLRMSTVFCHLSQSARPFALRLQQQHGLGTRLQLPTERQREDGFQLLARDWFNDRDARDSIERWWPRYHGPPIVYAFT